MRNILEKRTRIRIILINFLNKEVILIDFIIYKIIRLHNEVCNLNILQITVSPLLFLFKGHTMQHEITSVRYPAMKTIR